MTSFENEYRYNTKKGSKKKKTTNFYQMYMKMKKKNYTHEFILITEAKSNFWDYSQFMLLHLLNCMSFCEFAHFLI
jgi:hypothetical protein